MPVRSYDRGSSDVSVKSDVGWTEGAKRLELDSKYPSPLTSQQKAISRGFAVGVGGALLGGVAGGLLVGGTTGVGFGVGSIVTGKQIGRAHV